jgi:hypothetical protein
MAPTAPLPWITAARDISTMMPPLCSFGLGSKFPETYVQRGSPGALGARNPRRLLKIRISKHYVGRHVGVTADQSQAAPRTPLESP